MVTGVLLAESLRVGAELQVEGLRLTRVSRQDVSASAVDDQPTTWTFIEFEAADEVAQPLAEALAEALLVEGGWYADFHVGQDHVVVFANTIFRYGPDDREGRARTVAHGRAVGVPSHQLDWP
ncbi:MAG: hypothetical protein JXA67_01485 [Micromonosporaceae bacterium]|nr:hypothetical protein [Micromonosporaceae bacterium]